MRRSGTSLQERRCVPTNEYVGNRDAKDSKSGHPGARERRSENTREHPTPEPDILAYAFEFPPDKREIQIYNTRNTSPGRLRSRCQRPGPGAAGHHDARPRPSSRTHRPPGPALRVEHPRRHRLSWGSDWLRADWRGHGQLRKCGRLSQVSSKLIKGSNKLPTKASTPTMSTLLSFFLEGKGMRRPKSPCTRNLIQTLHLVREVKCSGKLHVRLVSGMSGFSGRVCAMDDIFCSDVGLPFRALLCCQCIAVSLTFSLPMMLGC